MFNREEKLMKSMRALAGTVMLAGMLGGTSAAALETVRTYSIPFYTGFSIFVADQLGLFEKHGIRTEPQWFPSGAPIVQAAAANQWDMTFLGAPPAVLGGPTLGLVTVGMVVEEAPIHQLLARPEVAEAARANPESLKGKRAFVTTLSTGHFMTEGCLQMMGLTQDDIQIIPSEQHATVSAFAAGEGDLAQVWPPQSTALRDRGAEVLCDADMAGQSIPSVWVAHPRFAAERPDLVAAWIAANLEAVEWMKQDPEQTLEMYRAYDQFRGFETSESGLREEAELAAGALTGAEQLALMTPGEGGSVSLVESYEAIAEFFVRVGRLQSVPDYGPLVDPSFMQQAVSGAN